MNFKTGDWVRVPRDKHIFQFTSTFTNDGIKYIADGYDDFYDQQGWAEDEVELWKPQQGEWCWFKSIQSFPVLVQFTGETFNDQLKFKTHCGNIWLTPDEIEPCLGTLPSFIKEQQC